jgi:DNA-binding transcriptional regulator YiaG
MAKVFNPDSIRIIREAHNLSMEQLAERLGGKTSRQLVHLWETGKHTPRADALTMIVNTLGLKSMDIFFTETDQRLKSE